MPKRLPKLPQPPEAKEYERDLNRDVDDSDRYEKPEPTNYATRG